MVNTRDKLVHMGIDGWLHPDYDEYVRGTHPDLKRHEDPQEGEKAKIKQERNYFKVHYKHILESDAILVINNAKKGIDNYIGGNALIEMGQAYVHDKKIFLLNDIPTDLTYADEIEAMEPICLKGNLENINEHLI